MQSVDLKTIKQEGLTRFSKILIADIKNNS